MSGPHEEGRRGSALWKRVGILREAFYMYLMDSKTTWVAATSYILTPMITLYTLGSSWRGFYFHSVFFSILVLKNRRFFSFSSSILVGAGFYLANFSKRGKSLPWVIKFRRYLLHSLRFTSPTAKVNPHVMKRYQINYSKNFFIYF